jgi:AraC-like DNA-binding protein
VPDLHWTQTFRELLPPPALTRYVSCLWLQHVSECAPAYRHRTVPSGCVELVAYLGSPTFTVVGPQRRATIDKVATGARVVGVRLRPGAALGLLGVPADELVDHRLSIDALWGRQGVQLADRLAQANSLQTAVSLLSDALEQRSRDALSLDPIVAEATHMLQPWCDVSIDDLARRLLLSPRQLRRRCVTAFGYGPKTLQRFLRFNGFLALSHRLPTTSIGQLANYSGYADQAHLTRESIELAGLPPAPLLAETRRECGPNHDHRVSRASLRQLLSRQWPSPSTATR